MDEGNSALIESSILELSKEMALLGLPPLESSEHSRPQVCESLLNAAWLLVHTIHCLSNSKGQAFQEDRESRLLDEKRSLQAQLSKMEQKAKSSDTKLQQEEKTNIKLRADIVDINSKLARQEQLVLTLQQKQTAQVGIYKNEIIKQEVENERLRNLLQKNIGVRSSSEKKIEGAISSISLQNDRVHHAESEHLLTCSLNRLMTSNHELINENLMLRNLVEYLHTDLAHLLQSASLIKMLLGNSTSAGEETDKNPFPENVFRLPLSHGMDMLSKLRHTQVFSLNEVLVSVKSHLFSQESRKTN